MLGAADWDAVALTAATTVVSRHDSDLILDAGSKVLGADRPAWGTGFGRLPDYPRARISALSEHHATVSFTEGGPLPELGSLVRVAPNHVCAAVNPSPMYSWSLPMERCGQWRVAAGGRTPRLAGGVGRSAYAEARLGQ